MNDLSKKYLYFLFCGLVLVTLTACHDRGRMNPLDPENINTGGKPTGLRVISKLDTVILSWQKYEVTTLSDFAVYRATASNQTPLKIATVPATSTTFLDTDVNYGVTYYYRISAITKDYESDLSDAVKITPGPTYTWVVEIATGGVAKLTHDYLHPIFYRQLNGYPEKVVVNPLTGGAWVYDDFLNWFYYFNANGNISYVSAGFNRVIDYDIDYQEGSVWLIKPEAPQLVKLNSVGEEQIEISELVSPVSLVVNQQYGLCWVADAGTGKIMSYNRSGRRAQIVSYPFLALKAITLHQKSGNLWVADSTRLLKFSIPGEQVVQPNQTFQKLSDVVIDQKTAACWVVDEGTVYKFNSEGILQFHTDRFHTPLSIAVNDYSGDCLAADGYNARLYRISPDGASISRIESVEYPSAVFVQFKGEEN